MNWTVMHMLTPTISYNPFSPYIEFMTEIGPTLVHIPNGCVNTSEQLSIHVFTVSVIHLTQWLSSANANLIASTTYALIIWN